PSALRVSASFPTRRSSDYDAVGNWETPGSQLVRVDTTKPSAPALSYGSFTNAALNGGVVYYRTGAAGSFDVTASSNDGESAVASDAIPTRRSSWPAAQSCA